MQKIEIKITDLYTGATEVLGSEPIGTGNLLAIALTGVTPPHTNLVFHGHGGGAAFVNNCREQKSIDAKVALSISIKGKEILTGILDFTTWEQVDGPAGVFTTVHLRSIKNAWFNEKIFNSKRYN